MKINVHAGHNSFTPGASSILNEFNEDRVVKNEVVKLLKNEGNTVYDCTDDAGRTEDDNLYNIVKKCNSHNVAYDISIHLNCGRKDLKGDDSTGGVEVWVYDNSKNSPVAEAERIAAAISKKLGIHNRGVKFSKALYVLRETKAPAMLVECCFVDDKDDADRWDAKECAKAIVEGILNQSIDDKPAEKPSSKPKPQPKPKRVNVDYQAFANKQWLANVRNCQNKDSNGYAGIFGYPILALQANTVGNAKDVGYLEYRVHKKGDSAKKWRYAWQRDRQKDKYGEYFAGDLKSEIDGLQMRLVNAPKGKKVRYRVHCIGKGWLDWITNYGSGNNGYAGWYGHSIDAVQIEII